MNTRRALLVVGIGVLLAAVGLGAWLGYNKYYSCANRPDIFQQEACKLERAVPQWDVLQLEMDVSESGATLEITISEDPPTTQEEFTPAVELLLAVISRIEAESPTDLVFITFAIPNDAGGYSALLFIGCRGGMEITIETAAQYCPLAVSAYEPVLESDVVWPGRGNP